MARNLLARVSWRSAVASGKQTLGEPSRSVNIMCISSDYEIVPPRFQRFDFISAGTITVGNHTRKVWYNLTVTWAPTQNCQLANSFRETYGVTQNASGRGRILKTAAWSLPPQVSSISKCITYSTNHQRCSFILIFRSAEPNPCGEMSLQLRTPANLSLDLLASVVANTGRLLCGPVE